VTTAQGQQQTQQNNNTQAAYQTAQDKLREKVRQANQQTATNLQFRGGRYRYW
jgi:hypothetical protein